MVREMKAAKAPEIDVKAAVSELKKRKKALQDKENELTADDIKIDRNAFETCLKKRFIFRQEPFKIFDNGLMSDPYKNLEVM